jgi:hypothetical protein
MGSSTKEIKVNEHQHAASVPGAISVEAEHEHWIRSGEPCLLCGERNTDLFAGRVGPADEDGYSTVEVFGPDYYSRVLLRGDQQPRQWLVQELAILNNPKERF